MTTTERPRSTRVLFRAVSATGVAFLSFGIVGSAWALVLQAQSGWGLATAARCCSDIDKAALGGLLASMFFVLSGSGVILLLHPVRAHLARQAGTAPPWWLHWMAVLLFVYSVGVFTLATVMAGMAEELEGFGPGIVTYCMLVGIGMLTAAWGFKRASEL